MTGQRRRRIRNLSVFGVALLLLATAAFTVWLSHDRAVVLTHPPRIPNTTTPADVGLTNAEDITFQTSDGLTLAGWFVPPERPSGATVVVLHGLGGNRSIILPVAALLAKQGFGALIYDARNHGDSDGAVTTLGLHEVRDVEAALATLADRDSVGPDAPIGLLGHSMGGATVLRATARIPAVDCVVAISAYATVEDNINEAVQTLTGLPSFPFGPLIVSFGEQEADASLYQVRPIDDLAAIAPRPVLFIHGSDDPLILVRNSERMYEAAGEPKQLLIIEGGQHGDIISDPPPEMAAALVSFFEACLGS